MKDLEASSKAAVRCARESITIRELLEPTPFLLSQVGEGFLPSSHTDSQQRMYFRAKEAHKNR